MKKTGDAAVKMLKLAVLPAPANRHLFGVGDDQSHAAEGVRGVHHGHG
jgi:hypothetical protein